MQVVEVYINCPDRAVAEEIAETLVRQRLAASANIFPEIRSMYWWDGAVQQASEFPLVLKTNPDAVRQIVDVVTSVHPYEVPCVLTRSVEAAFLGYGEWVHEQTSNR